MRDHWLVHPSVLNESTRGPAAGRYVCNALVKIDGIWINMAQRPIMHPHAMKVEQYQSQNPTEL